MRVFAILCSLVSASELVGNTIVAPLNAEDKQHLTELTHDNRYVCCPARLVYFRGHAMIWVVFSALFQCLLCLLDRPRQCGPAVLCWFTCRSHAIHMWSRELEPVSSLQKCCLWSKQWKVRRKHAKLILLIWRYHHCPGIFWGNVCQVFSAWLRINAPPKVPQLRQCCPVRCSVSTSAPCSFMWTSPVKMCCDSG